VTQVVPLCGPRALAVGQVLENGGKRFLHSGI
jgi:hypothetical protein